MLTIRSSVIIQPRTDPELMSSAPYRIHLSRTDMIMEVIIGGRFTPQNWDDLQSAIYTRIAEGFTHVDLDLRELFFINSMMLGMLVALSAELRNKKGQLRLVFKRESKLGELIRLAKLNQIIVTREV